MIFYCYLFIVILGVVVVTVVVFETKSLHISHSGLKPSYVVQAVPPSFWHLSCQGYSAVPPCLDMILCL
jgi:tellurite resistance protein TehA-like permease